MTEEIRRPTEGEGDFTAHSKDGAIIHDIVDENPGDQAHETTSPTASADSTLADTRQHDSKRAATHSAESTTVLDTIDEENLKERHEVQAVEAVPEREPQPHMPAKFEEVRASSVDKATADIRPEKKLGPLSGSEWFMALSVVALVLAIIVRLL